jgi:hypothetical protein
MDARFPTHYLNDRRVLRLSPDVFRTFVLATAWAVTNRTDGKIMADELPLIPFATDPAASALVLAELWTADSDGWTIADYANTQTSKSQLDGLQERRRNDAERQSRRRAKTKSEPSFSPEDHVRQSRDNKGKASARKGKERQVLSELTQAESEVLNTATGEVSEPSLSWPVVAIPTSDPGYCSHGMTTGKRCSGCERDRKAS